MEMPIENKIASSGLVNLDLGSMVNLNSIALFDIKEMLWQELVLKEKDFRKSVKEKDWSTFQDKNVGLICSSDTIVPVWAYVLISNAMANFAKTVVFGDKNRVIETIILQAIHHLDPHLYQDKRVLLKGCSDFEIPVNAYLAILDKLSPIVKSLMYGEACSSVPILKN